MRRLILALTLLASAALSQETLTNEGIINLVKSGMGEELILNVISKQPASFALGANDLIMLKNSGVSERVISAMLNKAKGGPAAGAPGATTTTGAEGTAKAGATPGTGVFYRKKDEVLELLSEDVEWKSAGAMKSIASAGIIRKDLKGNISGPSSRNFLQIPYEILITPPSGLSINDYALLPLRVNKGQRDFVIGPVNKKSGVSAGALAFGVEKVGANTFRLVFQSPLAPGEYGILMTRNTSSMTETTKMFTFRVIL